MINILGKQLRRDFLITGTCLAVFICLSLIKIKCASPSPEQPKQEIRSFLFFVENDSGNVGAVEELDSAPHDVRQPSVDGRVPIGYGVVGSASSQIWLSTYLGVPSIFVVDCPVGEQVDLIIRILPFYSISSEMELWSYLKSPKEVAELVSPFFESAGYNYLSRKFWASPVDRAVYPKQSRVVMGSAASLLYCGSAVLTVFFILRIAAQIGIRRMRIVRGACERCGYPAGLSGEPRCPECGRVSRHNGC